MARLHVDRELLAALDRSLGAPNTDKLLAMVPPDWTQLATKHDLTVMSAELRGEMTELRAEFKTTLHKELRKQTYFMTASLLALVGALLGSQAFG